MIKTKEQFREFGCENCPHLEMQGDANKVDDCTSASFEGMIIITDPSDAKQQLQAAAEAQPSSSSAAQGKASWVARWQGLDRYVRGVYAIHVFGSLPDEDAGNQHDDEDY